MVLLGQMIVFLLIMFVGYISRRVGILNANSGKVLSAVVVNIANPAMAIASVCDSDQALSNKELGMLFVAAVFLYGGLLLLAFVLPYLLRTKREDYSVYRLMLIFSNIGFMGYPLLTSMYGVQAVLCAIPFNLAYSVLIYTYGVKILTDKGDGDSGTFQLRSIFNLGVISGIIALIIFIGKFSLPATVVSACSTLGNLTAPLSMLVIGDTMYEMNFKDLVSDARLWIFSLIKLIIIPIIVLFALKPLDLSDMLYGVALVMIATPVGSMTAMMSQHYDNNYELAAKGVALTTILSVVTMPLVALIVGIK